METQPFYPLQISKDWTLISRTTIPVVYQQNVIGRTTQTGLSDSTESFLLSPVHTKSIIWGPGPAFLVPKGTNGLLSTRKFGIGRTHKRWPACDRVPEHLKKAVLGNWNQLAKPKSQALNRSPHHDKNRLFFRKAECVCAGDDEATSE
jgi:hypothetical protein